MQITHPYTDLTGGQWLRGNLHAHSTRSDGSRDPQLVLNDYAQRGYGFFMLSDHDICSTEEDCRCWDAKGMILICGNEISAQGPHLLHVHAERHVQPLKQRQKVFDAINEGRGFAVVNHPNWQDKFDHCTIQQMREWDGYIGMEIYNGVIGRLDGSPYATNKWDMLLADGRRIWGFANDDSHAITGDVELGWNVAYVKDRTAEGVVEALRNGRFYCSTGVVIKDIQVSGDTIRVATENARRIVALVQTGRRFKVVDGDTIEVKIPHTAKYVRFECWGDGEKFAWTQPFFIDEPPEKPSALPVNRKFINEWEVSELQKLTLEQATVPPAEDTKLKWVTITSPSSIGFTDVRQQIVDKPGVVYLRATVKSPRAQRGHLLLGYDGPVRVWLNGQQVFEGPGKNPAIADKTVLYANFKEGDNRLVIALDTNGGKAWGVFGRVEMAE